jgi:hypothetical protein
MTAPLSLIGKQRLTRLFIVSEPGFLSRRAAVDTQELQSPAHEASLPR